MPHVFTIPGFVTRSEVVRLICEVLEQAEPDVLEDFEYEYEVMDFNEGA